jgi:hypothetical protein
MSLMKVLAVLTFLALAVPAPAAAKGIASIVVVGAVGRSITIEPERAVLAVMLYHPASVYKVRPKPARPLGGYVKIYPLGPGGFPAIPGRFYPATRALCFSWDQALAPSECGRLGPPHRLLAATRRVALFHGRSAVLAKLHPAGTLNLVAALQLAFDRYRSARGTRRPARCLPFLATWYGPRATHQPTRICVSRRGVYARGRLYPAGPAMWRLALDAS